ncbi:MAG: S8 family serine peptidase [candidate division WOR-3 bacterium]
MVLLSLVLAFVGPGIQVTGRGLTFTPEPYAANHVIRFANGTVLDTRLAPATPSESLLRPGSAWLVHLTEPVRTDFQTGLRASGLEPACYIAYQTVVCRVAREVRAGLVLGLPFVAWLAPFQPDYKLAPELIATNGPAELVACLWPGESANRVADAIAAIGGRVVAVGLRTVTFTIESSQAAEVARLEAVSWVQMSDQGRPFNCEAQWVVQVGWRPEPPDTLAGRRVWSKGIRGQNMIVGLFDSGIYTEHDQFRDPCYQVTAPGIFPRHRKLAGYKLYRNAGLGDFNNFHGSAVAGTLAGNDSVCGNSSKADGMAPDARIFFVDIGTSYGAYVFSDDISDLLDSVRLALGLGEPVRQVSGSFGSDDRPGYYRLLDASLDAVAWKDKNFLVVWAAANLGIGLYRIGHPSCAKSALTIGACGNGVASNRVAIFSSRGPTRDERTKPNILAPGEAITSADGPLPFYYSRRDGTSFAAPAASGALVLCRQYLREGWFPLGRPDSSRSIPLPSSALMRGLAIAGADQDLSVGEYFPNNSAGWGRLNLANMLHFEDDSLRLTFVDETTGLTTGHYDEYRFDITERKPLRVVLVWTDTAAAPEALVAIVNDLDLEVISPDKNGYRGNQFLCGESRANPLQADERNVEEVCQLSQPIVGTWTLRVRARNVYTSRQPYAVVVRGSVAGIAGVREEDVCQHNEWQTDRTILVSPSWPLRLSVPTGCRLVVFSSLGRIVQKLESDREGTVFWTGAELAPGVYFYRFEPSRPGQLVCDLASEICPSGLPRGRILLTR